MRKVILLVLITALVLLSISFYLNPVEGSTATTTTTNTTYTNTTWTNTSLPPQVQQLFREMQNLVSQPFFGNQAYTAINQTHTVTTQTTPVQTSTTKVTAQQWYVQYAPGIVMVILLTLLGLLYKRRSKK